MFLARLAYLFETRTKTKDENKNGVAVFFLSTGERPETFHENCMRAGKNITCCVCVRVHVRGGAILTRVRFEYLRVDKVSS